MKTLMISLVFLLLNTNSFASEIEPPPTSLFFTDNETAEIEIAARDIVRDTSSSGIHLGAIIYYGSNAWKLWLQNREWTPGVNSTDLQIIDVSPTKVRLKWNGTANMPGQEILLRPHQTFQTSTGKIIEGLR